MFLQKGLSSCWRTCADDVDDEMDDVLDCRQKVVDSVEYNDTGDDDNENLFRKQYSLIPEWEMMRLFFKIMF